MLSSIGFALLSIIGAALACQSQQTLARNDDAAFRWFLGSCATYVCALALPGADLTITAWQRTNTLLARIVPDHAAAITADVPLVCFAIAYMMFCNVIALLFSDHSVPMTRQHRHR